MGIFNAAPKTTIADPVLTRLVKEDHVGWYSKPNLRKLYVCLFLCCMGVEMTSGFDSQLINTLQFSTTFNRYFGNGYMTGVGAKAAPAIKPSILGLLSACYQLGSLAGVPTAPWFNQKFGRRMAILFGSIIMVIGALLQGFAQNIGMYIFARMCLGYGIVYCIIAGSSLTGELGHPKDRPTLTSLFNSSYFIGAITAAAIALGTVNIKGNWAWRVPSLLQIVPSMLQIIFIFTIPDSPRWLISTGREEEALAILVKYHAEGDANNLLVKAEFAQMMAAIQLEKSIRKPSWLDMVKTPGMRKRTLIAAMIGLFGQMSGNTLLSYYSNILFQMLGFTTAYAKTRINLANQCWSLITSGGCAFIVARIRRRVSFLTSATLMCLVFTAMTISFEKVLEATAAKRVNNPAAVSALVWYFAYAPSYNLGNNALTYTYLIELFPYAERSRGIAVQQIFGKCGAFFSNYVNPIALTAITWKYLAIYCGWIAFEFVFIFLVYPETHGRSLEELSFMFEGEDLSNKIVDETENKIHEADISESGSEKGHTTHLEVAHKGQY